MDPGVLELLDKADIFFKLRLRARSVRLVRAREVRERSRDLEVRHLADAAHRLNRALVGRETDAAHARVDLDVDRLCDSSPLCEGVELFGGVERKDRGREVELYQVLELTVAGVAE